MTPSCRKNGPRDRRPGLFDAFSRWTCHATGHPLAFGAAVLVILAWVVTGPLFGYSDTWQLVINTGTTIVTFLMVFLIQHTQNRDSRAIHLKLDELIRAVKPAHNDLLAVDELGEEELEKLHARYVGLAARARRRLAGARARRGHAAR